MESKKTDQVTVNYYYSEQLSMKVPERFSAVHEFSMAPWTIDMILFFQRSSALTAATEQRWNFLQLEKGWLQILCRDEYDDVLIAKLTRKKIPFASLTVVFCGTPESLVPRTEKSCA